MNKHICLAVLMLMASLITFAQNETRGKVIRCGHQRSIARSLLLPDLRTESKTVSDQNGNFSLHKKTDSLSTFLHWLL